jgi:sporulation protein YlmC with PRC-barrel domain
MKTFVALAATALCLALVAVAGAQQSSPPSDQSQPSPSQSAPSSPPAASQPPASSAPAASSGGSSSQSDVLVDASSIIGATVRSQGKDVGKVDRLMVDPRDGRVRTVVVKMGGTLGMGGKTAAVPWDSVKLGQDNGKLVVSAEQQLLDQAPSASPPTDKRDDQGRQRDRNQRDKK